jgi:hypothetical protein
MAACRAKLLIMLTRSISARRWTRALPLLASLPIVLASSCKLVSSAANAPGKVASGMFGGTKEAERIPPNVLQGAVMRFADTFAARITQASLDFSERAGTREARIQALTWIIGQSTSAFTSAAGPNARIALLDMVVLVTLGRTTHENYWMPKVWGEADRPMLDAFVSLEEDAWGVARTIFKKEQLDKVRSTLDIWREQNPDMGVTGFVRLPTFQDIIKATVEGKDGGSSGLGDLISIDPLSGLEPAVREIERTRLFGERSMFYLQRAPLLLSFQVELLSLKTMSMPEIQTAIEGGQRVSLAAASIAETAAKLPESVRAEREAAVKQISDELTLQRQGIVADIAKAEEPASKMLVEARATMESGAKMSTALEGAIKSLDAFLAGLREASNSPEEPPPAPGEPSKPFDVSEYGVAAERVEGAARELHGLVATLDQSMPQVRKVVGEAVEGSDRAIDHAFVRGIQLGGLLIAGVAIAVLLVRWISARVFGSKARQVAA